MWQGKVAAKALLAVLIQQRDGKLAVTDYSKVEEL
jgi:hypothetical protein